MIAPLPDNPKKLVYFGTPEMAVLPLIHLVEAGFEILMVVTGEDKRRNRNSSPSHSPVKAKALELGSLSNVELVKGDLMDPESLNKAFEGVDVIFGNTTPTKGWKLFRGSIVRSYEMEQGFNLINQVKIAYKKGQLKHFIFSSITFRERRSGKENDSSKISL